MLIATVSYFLLLIPLPLFMPVSRDDAWTSWIIAIYYLFALGYATLGLAVLSGVPQLFEIFDHPSNLESTALCPEALGAQSFVFIATGISSRLLFEQSHGNSEAFWVLFRWRSWSLIIIGAEQAILLMAFVGITRRYGRHAVEASSAAQQIEARVTETSPLL